MFVQEKVAGEGTCVEEKPRLRPWRKSKRVDMKNFDLITSDKEIC